LINNEYWSEHRGDQTGSAIAWSCRSEYRNEHDYDRLATSGCIYNTARNEVRSRTRSGVPMYRNRNEFGQIRSSGTVKSDTNRGRGSAVDSEIERHNYFPDTDG
jgi:hypothetical protein